MRIFFCSILKDTGNDEGAEALTQILATLEDNKSATIEQIALATHQALQLMTSSPQVLLEVLKRGFPNEVEWKDAAIKKIAEMMEKNINMDWTFNVHFIGTNGCALLSDEEVDITRRRDCPRALKNSHFIGSNAGFQRYDAPTLLSGLTYVTPCSWTKEESAQADDDEDPVYRARCRAFDASFDADSGTCKQGDSQRVIVNLSFWIIGTFLQYHIHHLATPAFQKGNPDSFMNFKKDWNALKLKDHKVVCIMPIMFVLGHALGGDLRACSVSSPDPLAKDHFVLVSHFSLVREQNHRRMEQGAHTAAINIADIASGEVITLFGEFVGVCGKLTQSKNHHHSFRARIVDIDDKATLVEIGDDGPKGALCGRKRKASQDVKHKFLNPNSHNYEAAMAIHRATGCGPEELRQITIKMNKDQSKLWFHVPKSGKFRERNAAIAASFNIVEKLEKTDAAKTAAAEHHSTIATSQRAHVRAHRAAFNGGSSSASYSASPGPSSR